MRNLVERSDEAIVWLLMALFGVAPLATSLSRGVPLDAGKWSLVFVLGALAVLLWLAACYSAKKVEWVSGWFFWAVAAVVGTTFLSTVFSTSFWISLFGSGQETSTFFGIAFLVSMSCLYALFFRTAPRISQLISVFFVSSILVFFSVLYHVLFPGRFPLSFLAEPAANLVGTWNDLGVFFGLGVVVSFLCSVLQTPAGPRSRLSLAALCLSFAGLLITDVYAVWVFLAVFFLAALLYVFFYARELGFRTYAFTLVALLVLLASVFGGGSSVFFGSTLRSLGAPVTEHIRPSLSPTMEVAWSVLSRDPLFGAGPNRFTNEWFLSRPAGVMETPYWSTPFVFGVGFIPTALITTGVVGSAAWIFFLCAGAATVYRLLRRGNEDKDFHGYALLAGAATLYLWLFALVYTPNATLLIFTFAFTGIFVGVVSALDHIPLRSVSFDSKIPLPKLLFGIAFLAVILALCAQVFSYGALKHFGEGLVLGSQGEVGVARGEFREALRWSQNDLYYRALAEAGTARLNSIAGVPGGDLEALRAEFAEVGHEALDAAHAAVDYDSSNFLNWLALGNVHQALFGPGVGDAYTPARAAYNEALKLFPGNPSVYVAVARLEIAAKDNQKAKEYLAEALEKKPDFTPALLLAAELASREGDLVLLEKMSEEAVRSSPDDYGPRFFLGLAYVRLKKIESAIVTFEELRRRYPDREQVVKILADLRGGKSLFAQ